MKEVTLISVSCELGHSRFVPGCPFREGGVFNASALSKEGHKKPGDYTRPMGRQLIDGSPREDPPRIEGIRGF